MIFQTDDKNIQLEDTGMIKVHNYPASPKTYSYITRVYREYRKNQFGWKYVDGEPIYFHDLTQEQLVLAIIIGTAQNALSNSLPYEKYLTRID